MLETYINISRVTNRHYFFIENPQLFRRQYWHRNMGLAPTQVVYTPLSWSTYACSYKRGTCCCFQRLLYFWISALNHVIFSRGLIWIWRSPICLLCWSVSSGWSQGKERPQTCLLSLLYGFNDFSYGV